jgi:hypothetical protein
VKAPIFDEDFPYLNDQRGRTDYLQSRFGPGQQPGKARPEGRFGGGDQDPQP